MTYRTLTAQVIDRKIASALNTYDLPTKLKVKDFKGTDPKNGTNVSLKVTRTNLKFNGETEMRYDFSLVEDDGSVYYKLGGIRVIPTLNKSMRGYDILMFPMWLDLDDPKLHHLVTRESYDKRYSDYVDYWYFKQGFTKFLAMNLAEYQGSWHYVGGDFKFQSRMEQCGHDFNTYLMRGSKDIKLDDLP